MLRYLLIGGGLVMELTGHLLPLSRALAGLCLMVLGLCSLVLGAAWEGKVWYAHRHLGARQRPLLPGWIAPGGSAGAVAIGLILADSAVLWSAALLFLAVILFGMADGLFD